VIGSDLDPRTRRLLEGPLVPTLLRLGAPNVLIMLAQSAVGLIETFFVGKLGTDALAGMALVFPAVMLMQTVSAGALGAPSRQVSRVPSARVSVRKPMPWCCMRWSSQRCLERCSC
jgi:Na+-driven multidrug efflux pump